MTEAAKPVGVGATITVACLIAGNLLGAGILGLPINTGLSGVIPSFCAMVVVCAAMYFSALVLAREAIATKREDFNFPSLYRQHIGELGKWIAILANLLILYGLLTAYLTGATSILANLLGGAGREAYILAAVFVVLSGLTLVKVTIIQKFNTLFMLALAGSFVVLVVLAGGRMEAGRLAYTDWAYLPAAVPIVVTSFHFHNLIPTVCHALAWEEGAIRRTMLIGMLIGFAMNGLWVAVGVGALPLAEGPDSLLTAYTESLPATVPLGRVIGSSLFTLCAMVFALVAIVTSYIANGVGLLGFVGDFNRNILGRDSRALAALLAFVPQALIALLYPAIFLRAIDVVGGVGIVLLFGVLPALIALRGSGSLRRLGLPMLLLFLLFLAFEIAQETGLSHIAPHARAEAESWKHNLEKHPTRDGSADGPGPSPAVEGGEGEEHR